MIATSARVVRKDGLILHMATICPKVEVIIDLCREIMAGDDGEYVFLPVLNDYFLDIVELATEDGRLSPRPGRSGEVSQHGDIGVIAVTRQEWSKIRSGILDMSLRIETDTPGFRMFLSLLSQAENQEESSLFNAFLSRPSDSLLIPLGLTHYLKVWISARQRGAEGLVYLGKVLDILRDKVACSAGIANLALTIETFPHRELPRSCAICIDS